jgi:hypothetical protein
MIRNHPWIISSTPSEDTETEVWSEIPSGYFTSSVQTFYFLENIEGTGIGHADTNCRSPNLFVLAVYKDVIIS